MILIQILIINVSQQFIVLEKIQHPFCFYYINASNLYNDIWCNKYICQHKYTDCTKSQASETGFPTFSALRNGEREEGMVPCMWRASTHRSICAISKYVCLPLTQMERTCMQCLLLKQLGMHTDNRPPLLRPGSERLRWAVAWRLGIPAREFNI